MELKTNLSKIKSLLPQNVKLIAVSKTKSADVILEVYKLGQKDFGENKVQELQQKYQILPKDIRWHMIGHLQTNKVKYIAEFVTLIHGVDSVKLLQEINHRAIENQRTIDCLLQVHIAKEDTKFGFSKDEILMMLKNNEIANLQNIRICGLMGMATYTSDDIVVFNEFNELAIFFEQIKNTYFADKDYFNEISMGMSGDYLIAIRAGATMVRIGSSIFGNRE